MFSIRVLFSFSGRMNRREYAVVFFGSFVVLIAGVYLAILVSYVFERLAGNALEGLLGHASTDDDPGTLTVLLATPWIIAIWWIGLAALAKRFHDINRSGLACLWCVIPWVGFIIQLVMLGIPGSAGENKYGMPTNFFEPRRVSAFATLPSRT
jgi:uncharacterized membrane protein YhaH (DUF805 family)